MKFDILGLAPARKVDGDMKTSDSLVLTLAVPVIGSTLVSLARELACRVASASMITSYPFAFNASISFLRWSFKSFVLAFESNLLTSMSSSESSAAFLPASYPAAGLFMAYFNNPPWASGFILKPWVLASYWIGDNLFMNLGLDSCFTVTLF